jgi:hypothetical protein
VNDRADPADVAITRHRDVERRREGETVEAVQTRRRWAGRRARLTDVQQQRRQIDERSAGCAPDPEGVRTDLLQDTALDPASELAIAQPAGVRLRSRERSPLTFRDRLDAAMSDGHPANSTAPV